MKALITGHQGFIGAHLWRALEERGDNVVGLDRRSGSELLDCDLPNVDLVYHLAGQSDVVESFRDPISDAQDNILCTLRLLQAYPAPETCFVFAASAAALAPSSPYGVSKLAAEQYVAVLHEDYRILRLPNVYGPGGHGVINQFLRDDPIRIEGDGSQTRSFVHVDDIVKALLQAPTWPPGTFDLGCDPIRVQDVASEISLQRGVHCIRDSARNGDVQRGELPNTTPDWEPETDVLDWCRAQSHKLR